MLIAGGSMFAIQHSDKEKEQLPAEVSTATFKTAEELRLELEATGKYELEHGCVQPDGGLCGDSRKRLDSLLAEYETARSREEARSPEVMKAVTANIRTMSENPLTELVFQGTFDNPYTEVIPKQVEYYKDNRGIIYLVDPATHAIVQFTDESVNDSSNPLSEDQLRARTETYLSKYVTDFTEMKKTYNYVEASRSATVVVFRWNAPERVNGEQRLPFVQVKLAPSGKLIGFNDTRILYK